MVPIEKLKMVKHYNLFHILAFLIAFATTPASAGSSSAPEFVDEHWVSNLSMNDGLPHNFIDDIYKDSHGFIWIATSGSLSRYDGYDYVNFNPNDPVRHVKSPFVRKVAEDKFGRLWVADDGGIDVVDLSDLTTVEPADASGGFSKIATIPTGYVSSDASGNIWLRNTTDIVCLMFDKDGSIRRILSIPHKSGSTIVTAAIKPVTAGDPGVWTSIGSEICRLKIEKGKISVEKLPGFSLQGPDVYVGDYLEHRGRIWIATDRGLISYTPESKESVSYHAGAESDGFLSHPFITSLAESGKGAMMVGTLNGINIYDDRSGKFSRLRVSDIDSRIRGLNNDFINCIMTEGSNIWVGTEGCGVSLFSPRLLYSRTLRHNPEDKGSISCNPVNAIYEDGDGTLWVGTVEGGLNRRNPNGSGFEHFTREDGILPHNSVSAISSDQQGNLWVGTWGGGISLLDRRNPSRRVMLLSAQTNPGFPIDFISSLTYDPYNNLMWIGALSGMYVYDFSTRELRIPFEGASSARGSAGAVVLPSGELWTGGIEGICVIDLKSGRHNRDFSFRKLPYKLDHPESKVAEKVTCLMLGHDGKIWVGTNGNGIYRRDFKGGVETFVNFNTGDGLPNDIAHGMAEDLGGNIWIATYHGLSCMRADESFVNFGCNHGLDTEQFYWSAYFRRSNGEIMFGSLDGLLVIRGMADIKQKESMPVVFTSLTSDNETVYATGLTRKEIPENEKSFEVSFSSLDYAWGGQGIYYYRLSGFDDEWKTLPGGRHSVAYTNLSPGNYSLDVKYVLPGESPDKASVSSLAIEIVPNFYKRWWFMLLLVLLALAAVGAVYKWRVRDLTRQRNHLQQAVNDRVREISEQKNLIETNARELQEQNEELRQMARKVQTLTVDRISFFTNITHEFRTPITLIIGPIERAMKLSTNPKVIEQLSFVERNSKYLLNLVNQLMDFRKVESGKIEIVPSRGNFRKFVDELIPPFKAYARERNIELRILYHLSSQEFDYDEDALRKVIVNLLGNAIKFTPDNGKVTLYVSLFRSDRCGAPNTLYLSVSDTGCGLSEEDLNLVFDKFYQGKSQIKYPLIGASDSGIGLYLCRKIVEIYGGSITARNNHGEGCTFRVVVGVPEVKWVEAVEEPVPSRQSILPAYGDSSAGRLTFLVVEDNSDMRTFIRSILSDYYDVVEAENGKEALSILLTRPVDFIISDLMMPVMDGLELSGKVKENFAISHIPFLMLTAKTSEESRLEGYRKGVDEYLLKPFDEEMLLARIKNILDNKRRHQRQFMTDMEVDKLNITEDSSDKKFVDKVLEVARKNYQNSYFEVGDFAEALGVSRSLLNKKLNSLLGEGPNQFMRSFRLKIAHELLSKNRESRQMNVSEIAFEVGFNDSKYFTRCFTKEFGVSPSSVLRGESLNISEIKKEE